MKLLLKQLLRAALLVLALQPLYLLALIATDYGAPPELRRAQMAHIPPPPASGYDTIECVALAIGLEPRGVGLHNAIMAARPLSEGNPCHSLPATIAKSPTVTWLPYPRYWHGYRVVLDPLTAWLPMYPVRYLMLAAMIAALTWFAFELRVLFGVDAAFAMIVPVVALTDFWVIWNYTSQALVMIGIFAG